MLNQPTGLSELILTSLISIDKLGFRNSFSGKYCLQNKGSKILFLLYMCGLGKLRLWFDETAYFIGRLFLGVSHFVRKHPIGWSVNTTLLLQIWSKQEEPSGKCHFNSCVTWWHIYVVNFSEILIEILNFLFKKMHLIMWNVGLFILT